MQAGMRLYHIVRPLSEYPQASDLIVDARHPLKPVTLQCHLDADVLDVATLEADGFIVRQAWKPRR